MKKLTTLLLLLVFCFYSSAAQKAKRPPAGKARPKTTVVATSEIVRSPPAEAVTFGVTFESYKADYEVSAAGTAVQTWEFRQRMETAAAAARSRSFQRVFNGDLEKAEVLEAAVVKTDGRKIPVKPEQIAIKPTPQAEAAPSFSSLKEIKVDFPELAAGDATLLKIRLTQTKSLFAGHFDAFEMFPAVYAWKSVEINLSAPKELPLYVQAVGLEGGRLADENGRARWQLRRQNLAALAIEPLMADLLNASPLLAVTTFRNFEELGAAYWSEMKAKAVVTPAVKKLADEITKDAVSPSAQAHAIYDWANRNIRYLSIVLERGGWVSHDVTEILANGYGDCKDYTTVIYALLKAKGIESHPVLIRADLSPWFPEVAVPRYFNHAILYIPSLDLYADATAPNTRLGLIPQAIVGKRAILAGEKTGLIATPGDNPAGNQLLSETEITFAPDGGLKAISKNTYDGRSEIVFRPLFADSVIQQKSETFIKALLSYYGVSGSGKILKLGNPFQPGEPFTVELEVAVPNYTTFTAKGTLPMPVMVNLVNTLELEQIVEAETRRTNLPFGAARFRESFKLVLPNGVTAGELPAPVNFSNALGTYRNEFTLEAGGVRLVRELVIAKDVVAPKDYALLRELIKKSVEGFNAVVSYTADPQLARAKSRELKRRPPAPVKTKPFSVESLFEPAEEKLTPRQAAALEAKLRADAADEATRKRLIAYYFRTDLKPTAAQLKARLQHRLWFVQNRPEADEATLYDHFVPLFLADEAEDRALREEWLRQVEKQPKNSRVRLNAAEFIRSDEPDAAIRLLAEGGALDPQNYKLPLALSEIHFALNNDRIDPPTAEKMRENRLKAFEAGEAALALIKKERSVERDIDRSDLLLKMASAAVELGRDERAQALATELILEFGSSTAQPVYDKATHVGNVVLGRVALRRGETAKAKEHLLIAARAPLRQEGNYIPHIDLTLARELFAKGEKETVAEFLKLCEGFGIFKSDDDLYEEELAAIKAWQVQIKTGATPSFDFEKP